MVRHPLSLLLSKVAEKPTLEDLVELRKALLSRIDEVCSQGLYPTLALDTKELCREAQRESEETMNGAVENGLGGGRDGRALALRLNVASWWETTGEEPLVALVIEKPFSIEERSFSAGTIAVLRAGLARLLVELGLARPVETRRVSGALWKRY